MGRYTLLLSIAAVLAFAAPAAAKPKTLTVTFAGTGGTSADTFDIDMRSSPACRFTMSVQANARDIAWRAKWLKVRIPKKGKTTSRLVKGTLTGSGDAHYRSTMDPGCGQEAEPPQDCAQDLSDAPQARVAVKRAGNKLLVTTDLVQDEDGGEESAASSQAQKECDVGFRDQALVAAVEVPRRSRRMIVTNVDHTINDNGPEPTRSHMESHETHSEGGSTMKVDYVSDVTWGGVVTVRYG